MKNENDAMKANWHTESVTMLSVLCRPSRGFQKNKSPRNDGLTVEFYLAFWPVFGSLLVQSLNYAFEYGELSNSQKQAVITLVEKRGKDKGK